MSRETDAYGTLDKLPVFGSVRRRLRLELLPLATSGKAGRGRHYRYVDPKTGVVYVGHRWGLLTKRGTHKERTDR